MKEKQGLGTPDSGLSETSRPVAGTWSVHRKGTLRNAREQLDLASHWSPATSHRPPITNYGFTYIGLLIFIALMGIALGGTGVVWHTETRREKERELLFAGDQFRRAIGAYYERSPGSKQFPKALEDLLLDRRYPGTQRYLRRLYADPVGGTAEWGVLRGPEGGIVGVHSLSESEPLKRAGFPLKYDEFEGAAGYNEWRFKYLPAESADQPGPQPAVVPEKN